LKKASCLCLAYSASDCWHFGRSVRHIVYGRSSTVRSRPWRGRLYRRCWGREPQAPWRSLLSAAWRLGGLLAAGRLS
jgi:hypothetical protein